MPSWMGEVTHSIKLGYFSFRKPDRSLADFVHYARKVDASPRHVTGALCGAGAAGDGLQAGSYTGSGDVDRRKLRARAGSIL